MKIQVRMFGRFKQQFGDLREVEVPDGGTPLDVIKEVVATNSEEYRAIFDDQDRIRNHLVLMVNRKRISPSDYISIYLHDTDEVALLPPVAGG
jgi:molybdopterin converting factor small subunit